MEALDLLDLAEFDFANRQETSHRKIPFPLTCREAFLRGLSKREVKRARGFMSLVKLPILALQASQQHVSPIGVERFVLLALAGVIVPVPVVMHKKGIHMIDEGHHRLTALHDLGADVVEVQLVDFDDSLWR